MKRIIVLFTIVFLSTGIVGCSSNDNNVTSNIILDDKGSVSKSTHFTQLYIDFFEPYVDSIAQLTPESFDTENQSKLTNYKAETTTDDEGDIQYIKITDNTGNIVYLFFQPNDTFYTPQSDWVWTLWLLSYTSGDKEISISDLTHTYSTPKYETFDKNRDPQKQEVNGIDDLVSFMFD